MTVCMAIFFFLTIKYLFYCYFLCHKIYRCFQAELHRIWELEGTLEVIKHRDPQI